MSRKTSLALALVALALAGLAALVVGDLRLLTTGPPGDHSPGGPVSR
ncbi:hypothetical protein [Nonomuraea recticatena]